MTNTQIPRATSTTDALPVLLSVEGIAEHLGVTVRHVRQLVAEPCIPYVKRGHLVRFDPAEVDPMVGPVDTWKIRRIVEAS